MNGDKPCTVKELRAHIAQFPDDMPCYYSCCSAWSPLGVEEVSQHTMCEQGGWVELASAKWIAAEKPRMEALLFPGN